MSAAAHLAADACYVCGGREHRDTTATGGHRYWSNRDAAADFAADRATRPTYSDGTTTPEAHYVAEHRPY